MNVKSSHALVVCFSLMEKMVACIQILKRCEMALLTCWGILLHGRTSSSVSGVKGKFDSS
jgi:hypothetical protein